MFGAAIGLIAAIGALIVSTLLIRVAENRKERKAPCYFDNPRGTYQWLLQHNFSDGDAYEAVVQMTRDGLFGQEEKDRQLALDIDYDKHHAAAIKAERLGLPYYPNTVYPHHPPEDAYLLR